MIIKALILISVLSCVFGQDRKITATLNPGLNKNNTYITLIHVQADGSKDSVHQIWDFTQGMPTVIFAITKLNTTLNITWGDSRPNNFDFSTKPTYTFAAVIDQLFEYDDIKEHGEINSDSPQKGYELRYLIWNRTNLVLSNSEAALEVQSSRYLADDGWRNGIIHMKLDLIPFTDYALELPHLIHTANSTLIDISLHNLTTTPSYNSSRFALHLLVASDDDYNDFLKLTMRKSLDDEHTPGVFEIIEIKTPESYKSDDGGFVQFRPVGYISPARGVTSSTVAHVSVPTREQLPSLSTVTTFYNNTRGLVQAIFISFGDGGDGCYRKTNFTSWSYTIGYGLPPSEGFSPFVITIISIGLGVPVVLALSGILYVLVRNCKQRNARSRLTNED